MTSLKAQFCQPAPPGSLECQPGILDAPDAPGPYYLRIFIHVIRKTDGTGGLTYAQVEDALQYLDDTYNQYDIFFQWDCNINEINDDGVYFSTPTQDFFNTPTFQNNANSNGIDIVLFPDRPYPIAQGGGWAQATPSQALLVYGNSFLDPYIPFSRSLILSHEMGHCIGLRHTHEYIFQEGSENTDGSNCDVAGDCVCDTPADPNIYNQVNYPSCQWTGDDPIEEYNPDTKNIMSYSNPACMEYITPGQARRARNVIATTEILQMCLVRDVIDSYEVWDLTNTPGGIVTPEGDIVVEPGATLLIKAGITVQFPPNGRLIIQPNGRVVLEGTLTNQACGSGSCPSTCGDTWKGVEVWGNSNETQYFQNGIYQQGFLRCKEGAKIENAEKGVQLWGPDYQDNAGGILRCYKTDFVNNLIGIEIAPFENVNPSTGSKARYITTLSQCNFLTDNNYPHENNAFAFISMTGVEGVQIKGCDFKNTRSNPPGIEDITAFGYGITALSASFIVEEDCSQPAIPCPSYVNSSFEGLGYGISTSTANVFNPPPEYLIVQQADFVDCFVGINNRSISNATIVLNNFTMGTVPNTTLDANQVGISISSTVQGLDIQENTFTQASPNANLKTIGVYCFDLGAVNNTIRKNTFNGLNIGNEAGGNNGAVSGELGLLYQCNTNLNITEYDFLICDIEFGAPGTINPQQKEVDNLNGVDIASGNKFANTGTPTYRDFSNETAANDINYFHKFNGGTLEIPDEYSGLEILTDADENTCPSNYCAPPCDTEVQVALLKGDFYAHRNNRDAAKSAYQTAQNNGDTILAAQKYTEMLSHRQRMDQASQRILLFTKMDTLNYSLDSVRTWLSLAENLSAELELALNYYSRGDFITASSLLTNAPLKFALTSSELGDLSDLQSLFNQLLSKDVFSLSATDITFLLGLAQNKDGLAPALAKNILSLYGRHYPPATESCTIIGGEPETRSLNRNRNASLLKVYPNPANQKINFEWFGDAIQLQILDITGRMIHQTVINQSYQWNTSSVPEGIYLYRLHREQNQMLSGRIIIQH
jgi:hypothetical protein